MADYRTSPRNTNNSPISRIRIKRGITQAQLAELVGVHKNMVYGWEAGKFKPRGENLLKIADALDCEAKELIQK